MEDVWTRASQSRHTIIIGHPDLSPLDHRETLVVRVSCDGRSTTHGPLGEARDRIGRLVGEEHPGFIGAAVERVGDSLRRRLLGEMPESAPEASLVALCNRLADATAGNAVLLFEGLERADLATCKTLQDIIERPSWLRLPLILSFRTAPTEPEHRNLVELARRVLGPEGVIEVEPAKPSEDKPAPLPDLSAEVLRVLRLAAVVGPTFEAELLAKVLDVSPSFVLERLQDAADAGLPILDRGDGTLSIPVDLSSRLLERVLPSLAAHWHRRIAETLDASEPEPVIETPRAIPVETVEQTPAANDPPYPGVFEGGASPPSSNDKPAPATVSSKPWERAGDPAPGKDEVSPADKPPTAANDVDEPPSIVDVSSDDWTPRRREGARRHRRRDAAAAGAHLSKAGDFEAAVARYVGAIEELGDHGDARRALLLAEEALRTLLPIVTTPTGKRLSARILLAAGRAQWHGAAMGPMSSLQQALETLDKAKALQPPQAPASERAALAAAIAGVCYDLGDVRSLERALEELTAASQALQTAGDSIAAARLLNDQAAVYLRAGDPVRATHLLGRSRDVFVGLRRQRSEDPMVAEELAETEHLLARLPLRAKLRPGREDDAYSLAMGHARAAAEGYERLGRPRPLARVWETMGRLELARGRIEQAIQRLDAAARLQRGLGDAIGLARTAGALSDVFIAAGGVVEALTVLGESVALNEDKGSPLGLAFNRKAFQTLRAAIEEGLSESGPAHALLDEVGKRLETAEAALGRVALPGEP